MSTTIARIFAGAATVAALSLGLAGTASAGEPRDNGFGSQECTNVGITLLGCTQLTDVLNLTDILDEVSVLSELVETGDVLTDAQIPVAGVAGK